MVFSKEFFWSPPEEQDEPLKLTREEYQENYPVFRNWFNIHSNVAGDHAENPQSKFIFSCKLGPIKKSSGKRETATTRRVTSINTHHSCEVKLHIKPKKDGYIYMAERQT